MDALRKAVKALEYFGSKPTDAGHAELDPLDAVRRACLIVADALLAEADPRTADRADRPYGPPIAVTTRVHAVRYTADWLRGFEGDLRVYADSKEQAIAAAQDVLVAAANRRHTAGLAHGWEILGVEETRP